MAIPTIKILFPVSSIVETNLILVSHFSFPDSVLASLYPVRAMPSSAPASPLSSPLTLPQVIIFLRVPNWFFV